MDRQDFEGLDKAELLIAIEKVRPGLSFPETASREDLIQYLVGLIPTDPNEDGDNRLGVGVEALFMRRPSLPVREVGVISKFLRWSLVRALTEHDPETIPRQEAPSVGVYRILPESKNIHVVTSRRAARAARERVRWPWTVSWANSGTAPDSTTIRSMPPSRAANNREISLSTLRTNLAAQELVRIPKFWKKS